MSDIVNDIQKFRELLNKTPEQLNEMFNFDQKKGGQARPPQDKLGMRPEQGVAKHPEDYKDMMTNPKMAHVKNAYAAGGPKGELPEDEDSSFIKDIVDEGGDLEEADSSAVQAITPLYQKVQGLVPSFKEPVRGHLLNAQKSLRAALDAAQGGQVNEDEMVTENEKVKVLSYNSGYGQQLDAVAKDPKHWTEVTGTLRMGSNGQPQLVFNDGAGQAYANWNPKYGWVADYD